MSDRFSMSCTWIVAALVAVYWLLPAAWAQSSGEEVHVTPRVEQAQTKNGEPIDDPTLKTRIVNAAITVAMSAAIAMHDRWSFK